jgi:hypothetical protein
VSPEHLASYGDDGVEVGADGRAGDERDSDEEADHRTESSRIAGSAA